MKINNLNYKKYLGSIETDIENEILYGKILFINDTVTYEAPDLKLLKAEFKVAVDDYLQTCEQLGREPQKTCSGSFNIRVGKSVHRDAVVYARKKGQKLNDFCREAILDKVIREKKGERKNKTTAIQKPKGMPA